MDIHNYDQHEEKIANSNLVAMYYSTPTCGVCHALKPKVKALFDDLDLQMHSIDLVDLPKLASMHRVMGVPTLLVFENGKEWIREGAYLQIDELKKQLKRYKDLTADF